MDDHSDVIMDYYEEISSFSSLIEVLGNLPDYIAEEYVFDVERRNVFRGVLDVVERGDKALIVGMSGCGKTALLAMILAELLKRGIKIGRIKEGSSIGSEHLSKGIILFYDDLNRLDEPTLMGLSKTRMWVATLREEEYPLLAKRVPEVFQQVEIFRISPMQKKDLEIILERYSNREGITISREAQKAIIRRALIQKDRGLPQFIWLVIRDARIRGITKITRTFVREIPKSVVAYIETIILRAIRDADWEDKVATLALLMFMADAPGYAVEDELIYELYELMTGKSGGKALANIVRYLARSQGKLKIPHDSWVDVLRKPDLLKYEVSRARKKYKELKGLLGRVLDRMRAKGIETRPISRTVLWLEAKRIARELESSKEKIDIIVSPKITAPVISLIDCAREYIQKRLFVDKNEVPEHLRESIRALVKMGEIFEGEKYYYQKEYWTKLLATIKDILNKKGTVSLMFIRSKADPQDVLKVLRPPEYHIAGEYIVTRKWLEEKIIEITKLIGRIHLEDIAQTLKITADIARDIAGKTGKIILQYGELWYKDYYIEKLLEAKKLRKLGYTLEEIEKLVGIKIRGDLGSPCMQWQGFIIDKERCVAERIKGKISVLRILAKITVIYAIIKLIIKFTLRQFIESLISMSCIPEILRLITIGYMNLPMTETILFIWALMLSLGLLRTPEKIDFRYHYLDNSAEDSALIISAVVLISILGFLGYDLGGILGAFAGFLGGIFIGWLLGFIVVAIIEPFTENLIVDSKFLANVESISFICLFTIWLFDFPLWVLLASTIIALSNIIGAGENMLREFTKSYLKENFCLDNSVISLILGKKHISGKYLNRLFTEQEYKIFRKPLRICKIE